MPEPTPAKDSPVGFFVLTFLLSLPFYALATLAHLGVLGGPETGPLYLALFTVAPITAATILTFRRGGSGALKELLGRIFDVERIAGRRWYAAILLLPPLVLLLSVAGTALSGAPMPPPLVPPLTLPVMFLFFFLLATGEEVGWMGYAFDRMEAQGGALGAALVLGVIWAFWHLPLLVFLMPDPVVLAAELAALVGGRVLVAWIFNNTGKSVFAAIVFHAAGNTALVTMPEIKAVTPWGAGAHCGLVLVAAVVVTFLRGSRTLARHRFGS